MSPGHYWIELSIDTTMKRNQRNMIYAAPGVLKSTIIESQDSNHDQQDKNLSNSIGSSDN